MRLFKKDFFVIDMHCHVGDTTLPDKIGQSGANNPGVCKVYESLEGLQKNVGWNGGVIGLNGTPKNYLNIMQKSGTDLSVFAMLSFSEELGGVELSSSEFLATEVLAKYPRDKYLAYAGVDPRLPDKVKEKKIEYYVNNYGFTGIKLNPNDWGTFPLNDPKVMAIYKKCNELNVPIHIHTGVDPTGVIAYGNPLLLEEIAIKFPKLKLMLEHYGFPWKYEAYAMCRKYENVYLTLAWHFNDLVHHNKFLAWQELEEMRIHAGIDKILYGSDFPASPNQKEVIDFLKYERVPLTMRRMGFHKWSHEMRAKVLGLNAAKVLGISNEKIEKLNARFTKKEEQVFTLEWSQDALQVLDTIPGFIRKQAAKRIEIFAKEHKIKLVTPEVMQNARKA